MLFHVIHNALLHRRWIPISAAWASTTRSATLAIPALAALATLTGAIAAVVLRKCAGHAESQRRRHRAQCNNAIHFHRTSYFGWLLFFPPPHPNKNRNAACGFELTTQRVCQQQKCAFAEIPSLCAAQFLHNHKQATIFCASDG
jgi:hypothetical protein